MEYSQTRCKIHPRTEGSVLILILMEYSQTCFVSCYDKLLSVLILILMEYSQTTKNTGMLLLATSLNPYSNGILTDDTQTDTINLSYLS